MTAFLGIDPGLDGCVVWIAENGVIHFNDIPTLEVKTAKGKRREYDINEVLRILRMFSSPNLVAAVEKVGPMPSQRKELGQEDMPSAGSLQNFSLGQGLMLWKALLTAEGIPYDLVHSTVWKKEMRVMQGKDAGRLRALELFPSVAEYLSRKKDDGRADALLIAEWLRRRGVLPLAVGE